MTPPVHERLTLARILADGPAIHGEADATELITHGLTPEALEFIERTVKAGDRTLETGSGFSTLRSPRSGQAHLRRAQPARGRPALRLPPGQ